jgi:3-deoxy-7-phosphoheptulonate synthase
MNKQNNQIHNVNVAAKTILPTPADVMAELPMSSGAEATVLRSRATMEDILDGKDPRLFVVVGPCSIHDVKAATEYADRLQDLAEEVADTLFLLMRVYFEKPRTTVGWKGLINDPYMDDSFQIEKGIRIARELLLNLGERGLPAATEALDPIMPQYMGSGLSTAVGFKNGTDGSLKVAINALESARQPHHFLGINQDGRTAVFQTRGNRYGHIVLRGGGGRPNYSADDVASSERALRDAGLPESIVIDCSHANSHKDHARQPAVAADCVAQILAGNESICGMMLESNLEAGNQKIPADLANLKFGVSVTDACIDWETTRRTLQDAATKLRPVIEARRSS